MITDCHLHSFANPPFAKTAAPQSGANVPRDVRCAVGVQAPVDGTDNSRLVEIPGTGGPSPRAVSP